MGPIKGHPWDLLHNETERLQPLGRMYARSCNIITLIVFNYSLCCCKHRIKNSVSIVKSNGVSNCGGRCSFSNPGGSEGFRKSFFLWIFHHGIPVHQNTCVLTLRKWGFCAGKWGFCAGKEVYAHGIEVYALRKEVYAQGKEVCAWANEVYLHVNEVYAQERRFERREKRFICRERRFLRRREQYVSIFLMRSVPFDDLQPINVTPPPCLFPSQPPKKRISGRNTYLYAMFWNVRQNIVIYLNI